MDRSMRQVVEKYHEVIEETLRFLKENMDRTRSQEMDMESLMKAFFESEYCLKPEIGDLCLFMKAVLRRLRNKYGILTELLEDPEVNEIMVNGPTRIFVERNRKLEEIDDAFTSENELEGLIRMLASDVHREINEANPIVDARMPSGYRINGVLKNIAINGPSLTIRKFREEAITLEELVGFGALTEACAEDLKALVICGYNIFISGGTSTGKTTMLNALASNIRKEERVIIIEDSAELELRSLRNTVHMECRSANSVGKGEVTMAQLIRSSLRMRPDRIIVGEVRGKEAVDMVQAMNTGHDGSLSSGHGNSIMGMLNRLETMFLMDAPIPISAIKSQIANALEIFVHLKRESNGLRHVSEVAELLGLENGEYCLNCLYRRNEEGVLEATGNALRKRDKLIQGGFDDRFPSL